MEVPLDPVELQLKQATRLKNVLEALTDMFSEANFDFSGTGCEIQAVDTSRVTLVASLRHDAFDHYHCDHDISMGLNLADMAAVLGSANNGDEITVTADEGYSDPLCIELKSPENGEISHFYFDAMDIEGAPFKIWEPSESEYEAIVRLPSHVFMCICENSDWDNVVIITVDEEGVCFSPGEKNGTKISPQKEHTQIEKKENVSLMFALSYIKSFSKVSTLSDQVTIGLSSSSKKPVVFKCEIPGIGNVRMLCHQCQLMQNE